MFTRKEKGIFFAMYLIHQLCPYIDMSRLFISLEKPQKNVIFFSGPTTKTLSLVVTFFRIFFLFPLSGPTTNVPNKIEIIQ